MTLIEILATISMAAGCLFFIGGTVGLLRFPDVFTRLHALTKADNLGLGLVAFGAMPLVETPWDALKILIVWLVALIASATSAYLIALQARRSIRLRDVDR
ncbi:MAG: cation:proton antiporter [Sphingorhabdus sp.]